VTANTNGSSFDLRPYDGDIRLILNANTVGGTTPTLDVKIQESDDGTTWTDSGVAFTQVTSGSSFQVLVATAEKFKRYIRAVDTVGGTNPSFGRSVNLVAKKRM
jgi:hypothetical protein